MECIIQIQIEGAEEIEAERKPPPPHKPNEKFRSKDSWSIFLLLKIQEKRGGHG
jgi:hypothetical protein